MTLPEDLSKFAALREIIAKLRAPDGCPWDRKQTHASRCGNPSCRNVTKCWKAWTKKTPRNYVKNSATCFYISCCRLKLREEAGEFKIDDVIKGY